MLVKWYVLINCSKSWKNNLNSVLIKDILLDEIYKKKIVVEKLIEYILNG